MARTDKYLNKENRKEKKNEVGASATVSPRSQYWVLSRIHATRSKIDRLGADRDRRASKRAHIYIHLIVIALAHIAIRSETVENKKMPACRCGFELLLLLRRRIDDEVR